MSAAFPPERRGAALGIFFAVTGLAVASGPLVGGAIAEGLAWQWIFWLNVPIGLVVVPLVLARHAGELRARPRARPPRPRARERRRARPRLGARARQPRRLGQRRGARPRSRRRGCCSSPSCAWELRARAPMLPMRFFRSRAFSAGNAAIFFAVGSLFCGVFFLAQFLQTGLGHGPLDAGLRLLPWTATLFFVAPVAGRARRPLRRAAVHGRSGRCCRRPGWAGSRSIADAGMAYGAR